MAKRKKHRKIKLETKRSTYVIIALGAFSLLVLAFAIFFPFRDNEWFYKSVSSLGTICLVISFISFLVSMREVFNHSYSILPRIFAILLSLVLMISWSTLYFLGMMI